MRRDICPGTLLLDPRLTTVMTTPGRRKRRRLYIGLSFTAQCRLLTRALRRSSRPTAEAECCARRSSAADSATATTTKRMIPVMRTSTGARAASRMETIADRLRLPWAVCGSSSSVRVMSASFGQCMARSALEIFVCACKWSRNRSECCSRGVARRSWSRVGCWDPICSGRCGVIDDGSFYWARGDRRSVRRVVGAPDGRGLQIDGIRCNLTVETFINCYTTCIRTHL